MLIYRLTLDAASGRDVTGRVNTSNGSAQAALDYTAQVNKLFTIPSGVTETTIYVPVNNESLYESTETLNLTLSNVQNASVAITSNVGSIINDDQPPTISIGDVESNEAGALNFTISLNAESAVNVTGVLSTTGFSAVSGTDFVPLSNKAFTITAGSQTTSVQVNLIDDLVYEASESMTATLGNLSNATADNLSARGTILDNDAMPHLSINDVSANESSNRITFTLSLNTISEVDVTGLAYTSGESATATDDFTSIEIQPFTITAGVTSTQVAVTILDDLLDEDNEIFTLYAVNVENADLLKVEGSGTILDNDVPPNLTITSTTFSESASGIVTATLSTPSGRIVSGSLSTSDGSAIATLDYGPLNQAHFSIPAGESYAIVEFYIINDQLDEESEDFQVSLVTVSNAIALNSAITVTLTDNDAAPTISAISSSASESQSTLNLPLRLSQISGKTITGTVSTSNGSVTSSSATAGSDYTALVNKVFTITKGLSETVVAIPLQNDTIDEVDESFNLTINSASNATIATATAAATILDNDAPGILTIGDATGDESKGILTFTVSLNTLSGLAVTGKASTVNGSATSNADFNALTSIPFTIPAGSSSTVISVTIHEDLSDEYDEQFFVNLSNLVNTQEGDSSATGKILDNDLPPTVTISGTSAQESSERLVFNVSISTASGKDIKLQVNTFDGSTTATSDYVQQSDRSFTIAAGKSSETIVVQVINDQSDEPDETLTLNTALIDPSTATLLSHNVTGTIIDDDLPPTLTVADLSAGESSGSLKFVLKLSAPSAYPIQGTVNTANGTASAGNDYTALVATPFSFPIGSAQVTITVPVLNDLEMETNETLTLTVADLSGASKQDATAIGTIQDEDSTGSGVLIIEVDVAPKSIQNFRFSPAFASQFYLDDEVDGAQRDMYSRSKSFTLAAGYHNVSENTPYSYFLMDVVCTSAGSVIQSGVTTALPVLGSGQTVTCTFVNQRGITIRSQSYNDLSKNRMYDQADAALAGVETKLFVTGQNTPLLTETTPGSGVIDWSYRKPGPYTICASNWPLAVPLMVQPTLVDPAYGLPCYRFNLRPGAIADVFFGFRVDDGTVVAAIEGINEFDPQQTQGSSEVGVLFSQMTDVEDDMQGYESPNETGEEEQLNRLFLPVVVR